MAAPRPLARRSFTPELANKRLTHAEALVLLPQAVKDVRWAADQLRATVAFKTATETDRLNARMGYLSKARDLADIVTRGATEAGAWRAPVELQGFQDAMAAFNRAGHPVVDKGGEEVRAALVAAVGALVRWAESL